MKLAPVGVAALIFSTVSQLGLEMLTVLFKYVGVVLLALVLHVLLTYSLILKFGAKTHVLSFYKSITEIIVTAFSTSSSNATLPTAIRVTNQTLKKRSDLVNFVLTIGATANQNGTALYEGATVLFLAQFYNIELTMLQQVAVVLLSVVAGIGTAGVPGGSLPFLVFVLFSIGVPVEGVGIIMGVDRLLDMSRTVVNVVGDVALAAWVVESEK
ncbi:hypothetical protein CHS0354_000748 [Potamilus streckersoni]|uniref:Amino acid transporter n=1 Tax=Potamilus streckersoni TaxID=2493646 RepID=A0AAE0T769_9BIVA|nr:hypothetical protein CHS0354_000748 [Potamilus streckersoni]